MMRITAVQIDPPKLHKTIVTYFSLDELHELCLDLALDFEELPPGGKSARVRGLIEMCQRQRRLVPLAEAVVAFRPNLPANQFLRDIANGDAPFKGLPAFEEADEEIFFGREALTAELVARVYQPPGGSSRQPDLSTNLREVDHEPTNFLAIVGASGSGKSSVMRAGMIPQLRRQTNWPIHLITPTAHPLQALAASLTRDSESVTATATLMDDLHKEPRALRLYAIRLLQNSKAERLLLVIDQFEELFTLCKDEAERTAFVENLVDAVADENQIAILLTLRADFYHHCLQFEPLHRLLEQQQKIVPQMGRAELRAAIELPAQQANLTFEGGLVDILLRDVGAADNQTPEPGALPLLSHALLETWQRRDPSENQLTLAGYQAAGGVQGAIAKTAESTFQRLSADRQKIARSIFLRLTELGEGTQDTRRRAALAELLPQNDSRATVEQVLKTLADARLLTTSDDGAEVAHEALIRQWPTLQSWLDEDREGLRLHRQLTEATLIWSINTQDESYLFTGARLQRVHDWLRTSRVAPLNEQEKLFLECSQKKQTRQTRQQQFFRLGLFGVVMLVVVVLSVAVILTQKQAKETENQRQITLAQSVAALSILVLGQRNDTELATLLALEGARLNWESKGSVDWFTGNDITSFWDIQINFNNILRGHEDWIRSVAFSPDGLTLASASADQTIRLWDLSDPTAEPKVLPGHEDVVRSVAFSPDGLTLASGGYDRTIRLWDLRDPVTEPTVLRGHEDLVLSVAFSPDGNTLASGGYDQTIRLWDLSDPAAEPKVLRGHEKRVLSVAFSPDGNTLASGSDDQTIRLWDLSDPVAEPKVLEGHGNWVSSVAFSPDGRALASASADRTIRLWDLSDPAAEPTVLRGHGSVVRSVGFLSDSHTLASASTDQTIRLWDLRHPTVEPTVLQGHENGVWSVAFSPDGLSLASASDDQTIRLWDLSISFIEQTVFPGHEDLIWSEAFSPDGNPQISGSPNQTIQLRAILEKLVEIGCQNMGRNLSWEEWQRYLPGEPYRQTCPNLRPHPSVPAEELQ